MSESKYVIDKITDVIDTDEIILCSQFKKIKVDTSILKKRTSSELLEDQQNDIKLNRRIIQVCADTIDENVILKDILRIFNKKSKK